MNTFVAYYAPDDRNHFTKKGFKSEKEAWKYVKSCLCKLCLQELKQGYCIHNNGKKDTKYPVKEVYLTSCGAEWFVLPEDKFNRVNSFDDILDGAGYKLYKPLKKANNAKSTKN